MPRKYVLVNSTSSSDTSLQYSSECTNHESRSDSESADERRNRRGRRRRHDRTPRESKEPAESLHWWLARWLSSEFAKLAVSVYEGGKGCIRYLSNTALQALPSARTVRELLQETSRDRRSRHHRKNRSSPIPGGSGESVKVRKSRKSQRKSRNGRKERPSSPIETYISLKHKKGPKYQNDRSPFPVKQGSSRSRHRHSLNESWIYEENWIENLLKEVKSNFKNPVKVKVYKVSPSEGPCSKSRSDNSQTDSKISISIEELVSPTYPSCNSDLISTSSGRVRYEKACLPTETRIPKTRCDKRVESTKPRCGSSASCRSIPKMLTKELEKLPTPKMPHRTSLSRRSPSDLSVVVGDGLKGATSTSRTRTTDENRSRNLVNCRERDVFYPAPGLRCRVVCEDVHSIIGESGQFDTVQNKVESGLSSAKPVCTDKKAEDSQHLLTLMQSDDSYEPDEHKVAPKEDMEVVFSGEGEVPLIEDFKVMGTNDVNEPDAHKEEIEVVFSGEGEVPLIEDSKVMGTGSNDFNEPDERKVSPKEDVEVAFSAEGEVPLIEDSKAMGSNDFNEPDVRKEGVEVVFSAEGEVPLIEDRKLNANATPDFPRDEGKMAQEEFGSCSIIQKRALSARQLGYDNCDPDAIQKPPAISSIQGLSSEKRLAPTSDDKCQSSSSGKMEPSCQCVTSSQRLEFPDCQTIEKQSRLSLLKSESGNGRAPLLPTSSQAPVTFVSTNKQRVFNGNEESRTDISRTIAVGTSSSPSTIEINQPRKKVQPEHFPRSRSSVSAKTTDDDPALLFCLTVRTGEPTDVSSVEVTGVSMLANATGTGSAPFSLASVGSTSKVKNVSSHQVPSKVDAERLEQVGSITESSQIHPKDSKTTSLPSLDEQSQNSSSLTKVAITGSTLDSTPSGEPIDVSSVEVTGVSMLASATGTSSAPFSLASIGSTSNIKNVSSHQMPSKVDAKRSEQVGSVTESSQIHPKDSKTISLPSLDEQSQNSSSLKKLAITGSALDSTPSKGILKDTSSSRSRLANNSADQLKPPSIPQLPADYESVHPDLVKSSSKESMNVLEDKSLSSPGSKVTSKDSLPNSLKSGSTLPAVSNFSVVNDPSDTIVVVVSETSAFQQDPSSKSTIQSARSIVESVTGSAGALSDTSRKSMIRNSNATGSAAPEAALTIVSSGAQYGGSQKDLVSAVGSSHHTRSKESRLSNDGAGSGSEGSNPTVCHANQEHNSCHSVLSGPNEPLEPMQSSVPMIVTASIATIGSAARAGGASKTGSNTEQGSPLPSPSVGDEHKSSQNDTGLHPVTLTEASAETAYPMEHHVESISLIRVDDSKATVTTEQNESAVSVSLVSTSESKDGPELHLTFGEVEKMSYMEAVSGQIKLPSLERFKALDRPSISKPNLPPIKEEVDPERLNKDRSPAPSILQQRRQSKVTPGLLKRKSRPSALSTASTFTNDVSDGSFSEYSHCASALDRCPCKKICECCTCGQRGSEKPSFAISRSFSKDRSVMDAQAKSVSNPRQSRISAIDFSSTPVPKNSLDVLRSPFYAHWDYYDLDQDHPVARFARRPDQAEFDNTDTILMKNVRVGGYTIPYLKLQTKEKVTSKMVCNFYKTRKLPFLGKGNSKGNIMNFKDNVAEKSSDSVQGKEDGEEKRKCQCKKVKAKEIVEEENIWKDYTRDDRAELMDFPTDMFLEKSSCSRIAEGGCNCIDQPEHARTVPVPATPCESCDCFISDVELESAPQLAMRRSHLTDMSDCDDSSIDKNAVVNEYICGLQELCANLCTMIGKMRLVIDDTSNSGSTFRSLMASPPRSWLPRPSRQKSCNESPDKEGVGK